MKNNQNPTHNIHEEPAFDSFTKDYAAKLQ